MNPLQSPLHVLSLSLKRVALLALAIWTCGSTCRPSNAAGAEPTGIVTPHSPLVARWVSQLPAAVKPKSEGLVLRCFETVGHPDVIGVSHGLIIRSSASRVTAIIDDYAHYKDLFEDIVAVRTKPIANGLFEAWEQKAPLIFLPHTRFSLNTLIHDEMPTRKVWHSRLVSSNQLLGNDVFVAVYPLDNERAYYWEVDFTNANWGLASSIAMSTIWSGAVSSTVVSDLDIKFRAENPTWSFARVREFAKQRADDHLVDHCVNHRVTLDLSKDPPLREP